ncbi:MAG: ATP-dependent zinc protease [Cyclobacteriaceae bacterium]
MKARYTIGRKDKVDLPELGVENVNAKIDTGAYTSSLHCKKIKVENGTLRCYIPLNQGGKTSKMYFETKHFRTKAVKSSNGIIQERYVIKTKITLFKKTYLAEFSLTDRSSMKNPILIGRKLLKDKFIVDVSRKNLSFDAKTNPS